MSSNQRRGPKRGSRSTGGRRSGQRGTTPMRKPPGARATPGRSAKGLGGDQVEGRRAVRELLLAGRRRTREVVLAADLDEASILDEIIDLADEAKVPIRSLSRAKFETMARTDAPQGVIANAAPLSSVELEDLAPTPQTFYLDFSALSASDLDGFGLDETSENLDAVRNATVERFRAIFGEFSDFVDVRSGTSASDEPTGEFSRISIKSSGVPGFTSDRLSDYEGVDIGNRNRSDSAEIYYDEIDNFHERDGFSFSSAQDVGLALGAAAPGTAGPVLRAHLSAERERVATKAGTELLAALGRLAEDPRRLLL